MGRQPHYIVMLKSKTLRLAGVIMGRSKNSDCGLKRCPSSFGLFCAEASAKGVTAKKLRRLRCKTLCRDKAALLAKWPIARI